MASDQTADPAGIVEQVPVDAGVAQVVEVPPDGFSIYAEIYALRLALD